MVEVKRLIALMLLAAFIITMTGCKKNYYNPNVEDNALAKTQVIIKDDSVNLEVGDVLKPEYKVTPEKDKDLKVTWSSSNEAIASIGKNGEIIAKQEGDAVITAKAEGDRAMATCNVKVIPLRKAIISGNVPSYSEVGATYNVSVKFENCSEPTVKIVSDCGGGSISAVNGTTKFGSSPTQLKVTGDTQISFSISGSKDINSLRILCFDNGEIIDEKEYNVNLKVQEN